MIYDCIIIGGGPAGLSAALYASRAGLTTLLLEKLMPGGQAATTAHVENYPGIAKINGADLCTAMFEQAVSFGAVFEYGEADRFENMEGDIKKIYDTAGNVYEGRTVIFALGARHRHLGLADEERLAGCGVSYCAVCDGAFFRGADVAVNGGGDTALSDALYLSAICRKVYLIHRRDQYRASDVLVRRVRSTPNIEEVLSQTVTGIEGENVVQTVVTSAGRRLDVSALFVAVGMIPDTEKLDFLPLKDGYIVTDAHRCCGKGLYAAGDATLTPLRQIVTAAADGAIAAVSAAEYLQLQSGRN